MVCTSTSSQRRRRRGELRSSRSNPTSVATHPVARSNTLPCHDQFLRGFVFQVFVVIACLLQWVLLGASLTCASRHGCCEGRRDERNRLAMYVVPSSLCSMHVLQEVVLFSSPRISRTIGGDASRHSQVTLYVHPTYLSCSDGRRQDNEDHRLSPSI